MCRGSDGAKCHRRVHHAADGATYNAELARHVAALEARLTEHATDV